MLTEIYNKENVCAVLISFNGNDTILKTLNAIIGQVARVVIVDNGSNEATKAILGTLESNKIEVLYNSKNHGIAFALNQGVRCALNYNFYYILTMDQDSIADCNMVDALLNCAYEHREDPAVVSFSPHIILDNEVKPKINNIYEKRYTVITSGNLIQANVFYRMGFFEEKLFIDSVDFDFCLRLLLNKYKIIRCYKAKLYHTIGVPLRNRIAGKEFVTMNHSHVRKYYIVRNNIFIFRKYFFKFPAFCLRKQMGMCSLLLHTLFFEDGRPNKFKYMYRGLCDGLLNKFGELKER